MWVKEIIRADEQLIRVKRYNYNTLYLSCTLATAFREVLEILPAERGLRVHECVFIFPRISLRAWVLLNIVGPTELTLARVSDTSAAVYMACPGMHMLGHVTSCVTEVRRIRQYDVTAMTSRYMVSSLPLRP